MIAHVLGGAEIRDSKLECNVFTNSLEFATLELYKACNEVYRCFTSNEKQQLQVLHTQLDQCLKLQTTYSNLSTAKVSQQTEQTLVSEAKKLHALTESLKAGESFLIPGGWPGTKKDQTPIAGHAMLYKIEKKSNGKFSFTLYNSGLGLQDYHRKQDEKYACSMQHSNIDKNTLNQSFFKDLVQLRVAANWKNRSQLSKELPPSPKTLYKQILEPLSTHKVTISPDEVIRAPQQAQTCTWQCITLWEEHSLKRDTFELLSLCTKMHTAKRWKRQASDGEKITKEIAGKMLERLNQEKQNFPQATKRLYQYHGKKSARTTPEKDDGRLAQQAKKHIPRTSTLQAKKSEDQRINKRTGPVRSYKDLSTDEIRNLFY